MRPSFSASDGTDFAGQTRKFCILNFINGQQHRKPAGILPSDQEGRRAVKYMSFALAGLFVVTVAAPASADDGAMGFNRNQARYEFAGTKAEQTSKYFPSQKMAELHVQLVSNYAGCQETLPKLGWNDLESYYYCSWLHSHMTPLGGRPGKALVATGFIGVHRPNR